MANKKEDSKQQEVNQGLAKQPNKIDEVPVGVYAYDMAIVDDFRVRFNYKKDGTPKTNNRVQITNQENVFNIIGDIENDNIQFPIISITRTGWSIKDFSQEAQNNAGVLMGYMDEDEDGRVKQVRLQAIPIQINYQVDIWTQSRIDNDIIARELIWFYWQRPQMLVKIPHGLDTTHVFNVAFELDITDNSDIAEHNSRGRYYRQTLGMYVDDGYLWRSSVTNVPIVAEAKYAIFDGEINDSMILESGTIESLYKNGDIKE